MFFWKPTNTARIKVVGTQYYRASLEQLAANPGGCPAMVQAYCQLVLEDENQHDPMAVAIHIHGQVVGHLSRSDAQDYRDCIAQFPREEVSANWAAIFITAGVKTADRTYDYIVEVDLPEDARAFPPGVLGRDVAEVTRIPGGFWPLEDLGGCAYRAMVWIPTADRSELASDLECHEVERADWGKSVFFVFNSQGLGWGRKLYELPLAQRRAVFGAAPLILRLEVDETRLAWLYMSVGGGTGC